MTRIHWLMIGAVTAAGLAALGCEESETQAGIETTETELTGEELEVREDETAGLQDQAGAEEGEEEEIFEDQEREMDRQTDAVAVNVRSEAPYGQYLVGPRGMPLYMFTTDTQGQSSDCYDQCADVWPPVTTQQSATAADPAIPEAMLGTIERRDGTEQVTYNGWPLYTYAQDQPGRITGQDQHGFGGEWYLMGPSGERIEATAEDQRQAAR